MSLKHCPTLTVPGLVFLQTIGNPSQCHLKMAQIKCMLVAVGLISVLAMASPVDVESGASNMASRHVTHGSQGTLDGQSRGVHDEPGFYRHFQSMIRKFSSMIFDANKEDERMGVSLAQAGSGDYGKDAALAYKPPSVKTATVAGEIGHSKDASPGDHRVRWSTPHIDPGDGFSFKIGGLQRSDSPFLDDTTLRRDEQSSSEKAVIAEDDGRFDNTGVSSTYATVISRAARLSVNEKDDAVWRGAPLQKTHRVDDAGVQQLPDTAVGDRSIWERMWQFPSDIGWFSGTSMAVENVRPTSPEHTYFSGYPDEATSAEHDGDGVQEVHRLDMETSGGRFGHHMIRPVVSWEENRVLWATNPPCSKPLMQDGQGGKFSGAGPCAGGFKPTIARRVLTDAPTSPTGSSHYYYSTTSPPPATSEYNYEYYLQPPSPTTEPDEYYYPTPSPTTEPDEYYYQTPSPTSAPEEYYFPTPSPTNAPDEYYFPTPAPTNAPEEYYVPTPAPTNEPDDEYYVPTPSPTNSPDEYYSPTPAPTNAPDEYYFPTPSPTNAPDEYYFPTPSPTNAPDEYYFPTPAPTNAPEEYYYPTPSPTNEPDEYYFPTPSPTNAPDEYYFPTPSPTNAPDEYYFPTPSPTNAPDEYYFPTPAPTNAPDEYYFPTPAPTNAPDEYYFPTPSPTNAPEEYYFPTPSPTNEPDEYYFPTPSPTNAPDEYYFPTPSPTNAPDEYYFPTPSPTNAPDEYYFPTPSPTNAPDEYYFPTPAPTNAPDEYYFPTPAPTNAPDEYYFPTPAPTPYVTQPWDIDPPTPAPTSTATAASDGASVDFLMPFPNLDIASFEDTRYTALL